MRNHKLKPRRGAAAMLAMMFMGLVATLAVAMFSMSSLGTQSAANLSDATFARSAAESGLRWQAYRLLTMPRPVVTEGKITKTVAVEKVWPGLKANIKNDYNLLTKSAEKGFYQEGTEQLVIDGVLTACPWVTSKEIALDDTSARFQLKVQFLPHAETAPQILRVTSTGYSGPAGRRAMRTASMEFEITKRVKYAVVGKVPIQLGRNAIVEGPLGTTSLVTSNRPTPLLMLSDFMHLAPQLTSRIENFNEFLRDHHAGYDNRISQTSASEYAAAVAAGYSDVSEDGYIDEFDLFVDHFDANHDGKVSLEDKNLNGIKDPGEDTNGNGSLDMEFVDSITGKPVDFNLFKAIDGLGAPRDEVEAIRDGFEDGHIDKRDGYAKVRGEISLAATAAAWENDLATREPGAMINDKIQGTVAPIDPTGQAVQFGTSDIFDLAPQNFEQAAALFKAKTGTAAGTTVRAAGRIENTVLSAADATWYSPQSVQITVAGTTGFKVGDIVTVADFNAANAPLSAANKAQAANGVGAAIERAPFGSTSFQATYKRPIFKNMTFKNVQIPKGMNAVFDKCKFEGVTWVESERDIMKPDNITIATLSSDGMNWSQRQIAAGGSLPSSFKDRVLVPSGTPAAGQVITHGSQKGNNLRFNNCTFEGPLANNYATAYTHFANSMEFTGATMFNNKVDQTATIVCPQTNIEMGSFTSPSSAPSTLVGVVVAGNIDIRGTSVVDGSIIITGDGAGNTTLAYFGGSDSETNPGAMPEGGFGRLNIRYNDKRALPDGILIPVEVIANPSSYREGSK